MSSRLTPRASRLLLASFLSALSPCRLFASGEPPSATLLGNQIAAAAADPAVSATAAGKPDTAYEPAGARLPSVASPASAESTPLKAEDPAFQPSQPAKATSALPAVGSAEAGEIGRLERLPAVTIPIQDDTLASAITTIATASGMNFIAPTAAAFPEHVTLSTKVNPWRLLNRLGERYGFTARYRDGIWEFNRASAGALIARVYTLKNTNLDVYKTTQNAFSAVGSISTGVPAATGPADGGMVFSAQSQKIIDDLRELVGLSGVTVGGAEGRKPGEAAADRPADDTGAAPASEAAAASRPVSGSKVIYIPDVNALYVACTRAQHDLVAGYLAVIDRTPKQVYVEARFFETAWDPKAILGINPQALQPRVALRGIEAKVDLARLSAQWERAVLSVDDLALQMNALQTDARSRLVQNPSVVTANNREVYFSVGDEEPFVSSNNIYPGVPNGGFGATTASIAIRRIGTSVNVVPTIFEGGSGGRRKIRLVVRIEVGALKGFREINTISVPVVSSQKYEYTTYVDDNQALAFGGLAGIGESDGVTKVPVAGDLPVVGYLFKSKSREIHQRNLVAYIIARVVDTPEPAALPAVGLRDPDAPAERGVFPD